MNYCGVIIGRDLRYKDGKLIYDRSKIAKSDTSSGIRKADDETAARLIRNTYYVLLTRGMLGTYVYCEDEGLREYLKSWLISQKDASPSIRYSDYLPKPLMAADGNKYGDIT